MDLHIVTFNPRNLFQPLSDTWCCLCHSVSTGITCLPWTFFSCSSAPVPPTSVHPLLLFSFSLCASSFCSCSSCSSSCSLLLLLLFLRVLLLHYLLLLLLLLLLFVLLLLLILLLLLPIPFLLLLLLLFLLLFLFNEIFLIVFQIIVQQQDVKMAGFRHLSAIVCVHQA